MLAACVPTAGCGGDDDDSSAGGGDAGVSHGDGGSTLPLGDSGAGMDATTLDGSSAGHDGGGGTDGGGSDAASSSDASSDAADDAADAADASDAADANPPPLAGRAGTVLFQQLREGDRVLKTAAAYFAQAGSYDDGRRAGTPECAQQAINPSCTFTLCTPLTADAGAAPVPSQAGVVTISGGGGFPAGGVVLAPNVAASYAVTSPASFDTTSVYMNAGDLLTYSAPGDTKSVGPFRVSVTAPAEVAVTSPVFTASGGVNLTSAALSRDLTVSWSGGLAGTSVLVTAYTLTEADDTEKIVQCLFPAGAGSGVVPAADGLAKLDVTNGDTVTGNFIVTPQSSATVTAGNAGESAAASDAWLITVTAEGTPQTSELTTTE